MWGSRPAARYPSTKGSLSRGVPISVGVDDRVACAAELLSFWASWSSALAPCPGPRRARLREKRPRLAQAKSANKFSHHLSLENGSANGRISLRRASVAWCLCEAGLIGSCAQSGVCTRERAMVRGMSMTVLPHTAARPADATVVVCVMDVAGSRHEVLPPRMIGAGVDVLFRSARRAPPP